MDGTAIRRKPIALSPVKGFRRHARCRAERRVFIQDAGGWEIPLDSVDFSANGMFVASDVLFDIGETHTLYFRNKDAQWLRLDATVVRVEEGTLDERVAPSEPTTPGMGYEFTSLDQTTYDSLCEMVGQL